jgi:antitoxin (DNA-binding transcriptional repressor) of toxin-antitoxin stability system
MKTTTVSNLRYDFPTILKCLEHGEEVAITLRGKLIGTLVPVGPKQPQTVQWPDVTKRLRKLHGKRMLHPIASILKKRESER